MPSPLILIMKLVVAIWVISLAIVLLWACWIACGFFVEILLGYRAALRSKRELRKAAKSLSTIHPLL